MCLDTVVCTTLDTMKLLLKLRTYSNKLMVSSHFCGGRPSSFLYVIFGLNHILEIFFPLFKAIKSIEFLYCLLQSTTTKTMTYGPLHSPLLGLPPSSAPPTRTPTPPPSSPSHPPSPSLHPSTPLALWAPHPPSPPSPLPALTVPLLLHPRLPSHTEPTTQSPVSLPCCQCSHRTPPPPQPCNRRGSNLH